MTRAGAEMELFEAGEVGTLNPKPLHFEYIPSESWSNLFGLAVAIAELWVSSAEFPCVRRFSEPHTRS